MGVLVDSGPQGGIIGVCRYPRSCCQKIHLLLLFDFIFQFSEFEPTFSLPLHSIFSSQITLN